MDRNVIGKNAGIVWRTLSDGQQRSYSELLEATGLNTLELASAIGWLAREGKIEFCSDEFSGEDSFYLMLNIYI